MTKTKQIIETGTKQTGRLVGAPRGPRKHQQRCDAILDAASALFVEKGRTSTSIDDIAERAKVAKGTLYHYFPDRAALLAELRNRYSQSFADRSVEAMNACAPEDLRARLDAWIHTVVREYVSQHELLDMIYTEPSVCDRCALSQEPVVLILSELIEEGERRGEWQAEDSVAAAVTMFHAMLGLSGDMIGTGADTDRVAPLLSQMFWNMLHPA